jgi:hypothetical protein
LSAVCDERCLRMPLAVVPNTRILPLVRSIVHDAERDQMPLLADGYENGRAHRFRYVPIMPGVVLSN